MNNIILMSDSYKFSHYDMYPDGTQTVYSYLEARKGATFNRTVFFGLQYYLKRYLEGKVVTKEKIDEAESVIDKHIGKGVFNRKGWEHILFEHGGCLPVAITAVEEGTPVDIDNVIMTVQNLDYKCWWLTNALETLLSQIWYPCTVATLSREIKMMLNQYLEWTSDDKTILPFQLHDFGFRGVSSVESAGLGGAAHLVNFMGTDTVEGMTLADMYYDSGVCGFSVPATEHSIMTSLGKEGEEQLFLHLLDKFPSGILSVVIDSYDYLNFINVIARKHKDRILARDGKVVFRPDSGEPVAVTSEVVNALGEVFGYDKNRKHFNVLNPKVGALWGDGIDYHGIRSILFQLKLEGWSSSNIVFGSGGGLLQKLNRDTQRFAFKSSAQERNDVWYDIYKAPRDSSKNSKKGRLALVKGDDGFRTVSFEGGVDNKLETVFHMGKIIKLTDFNKVRKNAEI